MKPLAATPYVLSFFGLLILAGCATARRTEPHTPPLAFADAKLQRGREVFYAHCHYCHPHGSAGLGPAIVNKPFPGFMMKFQVRHGLGTMPSIKEDKVSAEDLDGLVAYIKAVYANKPAPDRATPRRS